MATIWEIQPEVTATVVEGSFWNGLTVDARAALWRVDERTKELVEPLTRVESLVDGEEFVSSAIPEYRSLAGQWTRLLQDSGVTATQLANDYQERNAILYSWQLPTADDKACWQSTLDSEAAYVAWLERLQGLAPRSDLRIRGNQLAAEATMPLLQFLIVKRAIVLAMSLDPGPSPKTVSTLINLADNCMSEIEDIFLGQARGSDDDDEVVSLAEVRAKIDL